MVAAVLALSLALVPDPVTVARAPSAYAPLGDAAFTPAGQLGLLDAASEFGASSWDAQAAGGTGDQGASAASSLDAPMGGPAPVPAFEVVVPPREIGTGGHAGLVMAAWRTTTVSWYGPGFYGKRTACGVAMTQDLVGVAHRTLPCGTIVQFRSNGRTVAAPVVDRGPYVAGRIWDLTAGLCALLQHCYTGPIAWKIP
ncbi:MAG: septal ring lytic transglycosylase RlpA family protein [Candidatus Limnocylindrales bacterium]